MVELGKLEKLFKNGKISRREFISRVSALARRLFLLLFWGKAGPWPRRPPVEELCESARTAAAPPIPSIQPVWSAP